MMLSCGAKECRQQQAAANHDEDDNQKWDHSCTNFVKHQAFLAALLLVILDIARDPADDDDDDDSSTAPFVVVILIVNCPVVGYCQLVVIPGIFLNFKCITGRHVLPNMRCWSQNVRRTNILNFKTIFVINSTRQDERRRSKVSSFLTLLLGLSKQKPQSKSKDQPWINYFPFISSLLLLLLYCQQWLTFKRSRETRENLFVSLKEHEDFETYHLFLHGALSFVFRFGASLSANGQSSRSSYSSCYE